MYQTVFVLTEYNSDDRRTEILDVFSDEKAAQVAKEVAEQGAFPGIHHFVEEFDVIGD